MCLEYGLFMAEAEGYLNTKESCKQRMLRDIRYKYNMGHDKLTIDESYLADFDLTFDDLTKSDYTYNIYINKQKVFKHLSKNTLKSIKIFVIINI